MRLKIMSSLYGVPLQQLKLSDIFEYVEPVYATDNGEAPERGWMGEHWQYIIRLENEYYVVVNTVIRNKRDEHLLPIDERYIPEGAVYPDDDILEFSFDVDPNEPERYVMKVKDSEKDRFPNDESFRTFCSFANEQMKYVIDFLGSCRDCYSSCVIRDIPSIIEAGSNKLRRFDFILMDYLNSHEPEDENTLYAVYN